MRRLAAIPSAVTLVRACAIAALMSVTIPSALGVTAAGPAPAVAAGADWSSRQPLFVEHRYRIVGKLRLALFWITRDDVGSARMTWRSGGGVATASLLAGSDPQRAPRGLNQWAYVREEMRPDEAEAFTLHSLDKRQSDPQAPIGGGGGGPAFGVSCSLMRAGEMRSAVTTVDGGGVTYRRFGDLLDAIAASAQWQQRHASRPAGAHAGFLIALEHVLNVTAGENRRDALPGPVAYVYRNTVYDLQARERKWLGRTTVGARTFDELVRTDFSVRNRTTLEISKFRVTYAPVERGVALPVQIFYRPSFWLSIELRLDDAADAPADPAEDAALLTRMRAICGSAAPVISYR